MTTPSVCSSSYTAMQFIPGARQPPAAAHCNARQPRASASGFGRATAAAVCGFVRFRAFAGSAGSSTPFTWQQQTAGPRRAWAPGAGPPYFLSYQCHATQTATTASASASVRDQRRAQAQLARACPPNRVHAVSRRAGGNPPVLPAQLGRGRVWARAGGLLLPLVHWLKLPAQPPRVRLRGHMAAPLAGTSRGSSASGPRARRCLFACIAQARKLTQQPRAR